MEARALLTPSEASKPPGLREAPGEAPGTSGLSIPKDELVRLCGVDNELYALTFFPQTFRQASPAFARLMWDAMENPDVRYLNLIAFRDSSKTSRARIFASKRIAYGISRTILYVGASQDKAIQSVNWIKNRIERNHFWRDTYALGRGSKWEETQIEIEHKLLGFTIRVQAHGVSGSLRGINFDDYRPDLIIIDDPQDDESPNSEVQREKLVDLVLSAVKNSLAPVVDEPNAKMIMLITPQHPEDISQQARKDPSWTTLVFPCWTRETMDLPIAQQISVWPERHPTETLRKDKINHTIINKASLFAREKECRLINRETAQFRTNWLNIRESVNSAPRGRYAVLAIDPVPPPSEQQKQRGLKGKDWEAHYVWCRDGADYHLCDRERNRGHDPSWTVATAFSLARIWRVGRIIVDAVAYQRTLKWILEEEMKRTGVWYQVIPIADGMQKFARITNVIGGLATKKALWIGPEHTEFQQQFESYGQTYTGPDDDLDSSALALQELHNPFLQRIDEKTGDLLDDNVEEIPYRLMCP